MLLVAVGERIRQLADVTVVLESNGHGDGVAVRKKSTNWPM
jgi:hypothetical protein